MIMNLKPLLKNKLITIEPLKEEDFEVLYEVAKDPLIWDQHPAKRYKKEVFSEFFQQSLASGGAMIIIDNETAEVIGSSRFQSLEGFANGIEIGWTFLARKYWGGKYNASIKNLMITHALKHVDYAFFIVAKENERSKKAMEKIGGRLVEPDEFTQLPDKGDQKVIYVIERSSY